MTLRLKDSAVSWAPTEEDAVVVLDLRTSKYLSLNPSGSVIWQRLADGANADDLVGVLVDRFGLDEERAGEDVEAFLATLRDRDMLDEQ